jgi:hypothetical protein
MAVYESATYDYQIITCNGACPPFWFCSLTAPILFLKPLSSTPPTECIELAVDPRRG